MTEPRQKPGRSKQDYGTPLAFLTAAKALLGVQDFDCDLASDDANWVTPRHLTAREDALTCASWTFGTGWNWLNPPFADIAPWVRFAWMDAQTHGSQTAILIPAAVGSNWWRDYVHHKCRIELLNGRIKFVGAKDYYPKDCALLLYSPEYRRYPRYDVWTWKPSPSAGAVARSGGRVTGVPRAQECLS